MKKANRLQKIYIYENWFPCPENYSYNKCFRFFSVSVNVSQRRKTVLNIAYSHHKKNVTTGIGSRGKTLNYCTYRKEAITNTLHRCNFLARIRGLKIQIWNFKSGLSNFSHGKEIYRCGTLHPEFRANFNAKVSKT